MSNENRSPEQEHYDLLLHLSNNAFEMSKYVEHDVHIAKSETYDFAKDHFFATSILMERPVIQQKSNRQIFIEEAKNLSVKEDALLEENSADDLKGVL